MIEIYQRDGDDVEQVGKVEDGEYSGDDSLSYVSDWDEERILQSLDGPYTFATRSEEKSMVRGSLFQKAEWEPYVGPQGGNGWRNVETDEVAYQAQPPGGVTLPDEFPGELVDFGGEYDSVMDVPGDQPVLANDGEGNIIAEQLDDVPSDGFIFGVLEEESQTEEDSGENLEDQFSEEDELVDFDEFQEILDSDPVLTESISEDATGQQLIDEAIDVWDLPETYEDVDPSETLVGEIESTAEKFLGYEPDEHAGLTVEDFLKDLPSDTMPGDVHSLLVAADEDQNAPDPAEQDPITDGEFESEDIDRVPEGTFVELQDLGGEYITGEIVEVDEYDVTIETEDGEMKKSISGIYNAEAKANQSLEQIRETELSENPSQEELFERAEYLEFDDRPDDQKRGQFIREAIQADADHEDVYEVFQQHDVRPSIDKVMEKAVRQSGSVTVFRNSRYRCVVSSR